jgi:hypothetical protein
VIYEKWERGATASHVSQAMTENASWTTPVRHPPRKRGIQYAAAYGFDRWLLWNTGSPVKPGDDS